MNPLVELLADAQTDEERAAWLLACPLSLLLSEESTIRRVLQTCGFLQGVAYLDIEISALVGTRDDHGRQPLHMERCAARGVMRWRAAGNPFNERMTLL